MIHRNYYFRLLYKTIKFCENRGGLAHESFFLLLDKRGIQEFQEKFTNFGRTFNIWRKSKTMTIRKCHWSRRDTLFVCTFDVDEQTYEIVLTRHCLKSTVWQEYFKGNDGKTRGYEISLVREDRRRSGLRVRGARSFILSWRGDTSGETRP